MKPQHHPGSSDTPPSSATRVHLRHFSKSLPMSLLRAREAVMRQFRPALRAHAITEQQWRVLRALSTVASIEVAALARATFLLGPSLSRILQDLEARELIVRQANLADARRSVISISATGTALIATVTPRSEAIYRVITDRFGADKLASLQALLRELEDTVAAIEDDAERTGSAGNPLHAHLR